MMYSSKNYNKKKNSLRAKSLIKTLYCSKGTADRKGGYHQKLKI